jgi:hypothetical protein
LAEDINSPANEPQSDETSVSRRARGRSIAVPRSLFGRTASTRPRKVKAETAASAPRPSARKNHPLRSLVILTMVGGLVATVALPAYGAWRQPAEAQTLQQVAADDAQSLVVASDSTDTELSRGSYSATTPEEIQKKKDEEAAAAAAQAAAEAAAARARVTSSG